MSPSLKNVLICVSGGMMTLLVFYPIEVMSWFGHAPGQRLEAGQIIQGFPSDRPHPSRNDSNPGEY